MKFVIGRFFLKGVDKFVKNNFSLKGVMKFVIGRFFLKRLTNLSKKRRSPKIGTKIDTVR